MFFCFEKSLDVISHSRLEFSSRGCLTKIISYPGNAKKKCFPDKQRRQNPMLQKRRNPKCEKRKENARQKKKKKKKLLLSSMFSHFPHDCLILTAFPEISCFCLAACPFLFRLVTHFFDVFCFCIGASSRETGKKKKRGV